VGESSFWYRPTRVVPDQRPLNGRCLSTHKPETTKVPLVYRVVTKNGGTLTLCKYLIKRDFPCVATQVKGYWKQTLNVCCNSVNIKHYDLILCLQCFDAVGWAAGRASGL